MANRDLIQGDLAAAETHLLDVLEELTKLRDARAVNQVRACLDLIEAISNRVWVRQVQPQGGQS